MYWEGMRCVLLSLAQLWCTLGIVWVQQLLPSQQQACVRLNALPLCWGIKGRGCVGIGTICWLKQL